MFSQLLWQELGRWLDRVDHAGALGRNVLNCPASEWIAELLAESRLTRHLTLVCVDPTMRATFLPGWVNGKLDQLERAIFVEHLKICSRCRQEIVAIRQADWLWRLLRERPSP